MDRFLDLTEEKELCVGDEVAIHNVGAYTMSLAPLFIEYFPAVIVKNGEEYQVVREHWSTKEFTQKKLAKRLKMTESYVSKLITGERYSKDFEFFVRYNLGVDYFGI